MTETHQTYIDEELVPIRALLGASMRDNVRKMMALHLVIADARKHLTPEWVGEGQLIRRALAVVTAANVMLALAGEAGIQEAGIGAVPGAGDVLGAVAGLLDTLTAVELGVAHDPAIALTRTP